jgi:TetR/AcrR family transcriptional regulator, tetracycline repressor protein
MTDGEVVTSEKSYAGKGLDRQVIVHTALKFIDRHGSQGLTMRGLGQELGVEAMSLYRYVSGREDLLEAVITELLDDIRPHMDELLARTWQGYLQSLSHAVRQIAIEHPAAFPLVATRHPAAPWIRPPLRSLELVEDFLSTLSSFGFNDDQVVSTYRAFTSFLLGHLLLESAVRGAETSAVGEPLDEGGATVPNQDGRVDLSGSPTVSKFRTKLSEDRSAEEFEASLETLLDRLEMDMSQ